VKNIRKNLIEQNNIDAIIGLPANIFFGTGIPTIVMVLRQKRENTDVLIIDASKGFTKEGKNNKLRACDIRKIVDTIKSRKDVEKYSKVVSLEDIRANDYNLNIPRYVDSSEAAESYDIYASMFGGIPETELGKFDKYWEVFPSLKGELFTGEDYLSLKSENIKEAIKNNKDVLQFKKNHMLRFGDLGAYLDSILIANATTINIPKTQEIIANNIFMRFVDTTLIDPYGAYEIFEDKFTEISGDLELIQTEGIKAVTQVDPNMVIKKKNGKDVEVQEGWKGHILPFDLVQEICLSERKRDLKEKQEKLAEIPSSYEEILESLSEDDKEIISEALNDTNDAFVFKNIKAVVKSLKADGDSKELIESLEKVEKLNNEEKKPTPKNEDDSDIGLKIGTGTGAAYEINSGIKNSNNKNTTSTAQENSNKNANPSNQRGQVSQSNKNNANKAKAEESNQRVSKGATSNNQQGTPVSKISDVNKLEVSKGLSGTTQKNDSANKKPILQESKDDIIEKIIVIKIYNIIVFFIFNGYLNLDKFKNV